MTPQIDAIGDYDLLFTSLNEAIQGLEGSGMSVPGELQETIRLSEEIETLRAITEQVDADGATSRSLTLG